jgi:hypothetical protein
MTNNFRVGDRARLTTAHSGIVYAEVGDEVEITNVRTHGGYSGRMVTGRADRNTGYGFEEDWLAPVATAPTPATWDNATIGTRLRKARNGSGTSAIPLGATVRIVDRRDRDLVYLLVDPPHERSVTSAAPNGERFHWTTYNIDNFDLFEEPAAAAPAPAAESYTSGDGRTWTVGSIVRSGRHEYEVRPRSEYTGRWVSGSDYVALRRLEGGAMMYSSNGSDLELVTPAPTPETYQAGDQTWTVGERVRWTPRAGYTGEWVTFTGRVAARPAGSTVDLVFITPDPSSPGSAGRPEFQHRPAQMAADLITRIDTEETPVPTANPNAFTPEQEELIRRVTAEYGRRHGACSVAAQVLTELGISQPHEVRTVRVTLELDVPIRNQDGYQVQLPETIPDHYLAAAVTVEQLNAVADELIRGSGSQITREGNATLRARTVVDNPAS